MNNKNILCLLIVFLVNAKIWPSQVPFTLFDCAYDYVINNIDRFISSILSGKIPQDLAYDIIDDLPDDYFSKNAHKLSEIIENQDICLSVKELIKAKIHNIVFKPLYENHRELINRHSYFMLSPLLESDKLYAEFNKDLFLEPKYKLIFDGNSRSNYWLVSRDESERITYISISGYFRDRYNLPMALSSDKKFAAILNDNDAVMIYDLTRGDKRIVQCNISTTEVKSIAFNSDDSLLGVELNDGKVLVFSLPLDYMKGEMILKQLEYLLKVYNLNSYALNAITSLLNLISDLASYNFSHGASNMMMDYLESKLERSRSGRANKLCLYSGENFQKINNFLQTYLIDSQGLDYILKDIKLLPSRVKKKLLKKFKLLLQSTIDPDINLETKYDGVKHKIEYIDDINNKFVQCLNLLESVFVKNKNEKMSLEEFKLFLIKSMEEAIRYELIWQ